MSSMNRELPASTRVILLHPRDRRTYLPAPVVNATPRPAHTSPLPIT